MVVTTLLSIFAAFAIFIAFLCAGFFFKKIFFHSWQKTNPKPDQVIDRVTVLLFLNHAVAWFVMAGIWCASLVLFARAPAVQAAVNRVLIAAVIISFSGIIASLVSVALRAQAVKAGTASHMSLLVQRVARVGIFTLGFLTILATFGISIAPILTTLGIGGFAVALALQDTLANVFAGFYIVLARQIRIGDYIRLDGAEEGYVLDVSWRLTKIRTLANNVVLLPNSKVSQAIITNYHFPQKTSLVVFEVVLDPRVNLDQAQTIVEEVARTVVSEIEGAARDHDPVVRFQGFLPQGILCLITLAVKEISAQGLLRHELTKRLHARFREKGIEIAYVAPGTGIARGISMPDRSR